MVLGSESDSNHKHDLKSDLAATRINPEPAFQILGGLETAYILVTKAQDKGGFRKQRFLGSSYFIWSFGPLLV